MKIRFIHRTYIKTSNEWYAVIFFSKFCRKAPKYRIIVINSTTKREGKPIQELGHYDPKTKAMLLNLEAAQEWVKKGAQPTQTVQYLIDNCNKDGSLNYKPKTEKKLSKKAVAKLEAEKEAKAKAAEEAKAAKEAAAAAPAEAEVAAEAEAPVEEAKSEAAEEAPAE